MGNVVFSGSRTKVAWEAQDFQRNTAGSCQNYELKLLDFYLKKKKRGKKSPKFKSKLIYFFCKNLSWREEQEGSASD